MVRVIPLRMHPCLRGSWDKEQREGGIAAFVDGGNAKEGKSGCGCGCGGGGISNSESPSVRHPLPINDFQPPSTAVS